MNLSSTSRGRTAAILVIATALATAIGTSPAGVSGQEPLPEACAFQERSPNGVRAIDPTCATNIAVEAARAEAATWPDYDSTAISDAERNIAIDAATREAAGWPDYDSTAISAGGSTDITSNSPRMTQIGAQATSGVGDEVASSYDAPVAQSPQQTAF
jgi:hypothetical protein